MKPPEQMTDEELRIAVAEACGWINVRYDYANSSDGFKSFLGDKKGYVNGPPNYPYDLNVCHEMEGTLDVNGLSRYADELDEICVPTHICHLTHWQAVVMSTARQRCEAFIKVKCTDQA